jgi:hypothetical protein
MNANLPGWSVSADRLLLPPLRTLDADSFRLCGGSDAAVAVAVTVTVGVGVATVS